jgi:predicted transcriptional regulator
MLTKEKIKKSIDSLPEYLTIDQVIDRVIMLDKIEQGLKDVEEGNVYTTEEVNQRVILGNKLKQESGLVQNDSLSVLNEFERNDISGKVCQE